MSEIKDERRKGERRQRSIRHGDRRKRQVPVKVERRSGKDRRRTDRRGGRDRRQSEDS